MKVLALTKYGRLGASSRMRSLQYVPTLEQAGCQITVEPLLSDELLQARYKRGGYGISLLRAYGRRVRALKGRRKFDVVWIEKEALPWWPLWLELFMLRGVPYVLDYDDAIFHNYDQHASSWVRRFFGSRLDKLMAKSALVIAGNQYLAQRAINAGARWVEVVPTVVDLTRYPYPTFETHSEKSPAIDNLPRIVWIGSPSTVHYLQLLRKPLQELAARQPFVLRVIGGGPLDLPGVQVEIIPWTEATEGENIRTCHIGVMPLLDSLWERGKCGYKLIQYMACGLPVVASGVGANIEIVRHHKNGFLANTANDWVASLSKLLQSPSLREQMGAAGRITVEEKYSIQKTSPQISNFLKSIAGKH
ncbi:glycosyltransferase family 4 protein [Variovorax sp. KBS0712]|uniref:glycosyltransferase family 4 protein n=1 Tax=Variovorax sp. KBS0712 TaxID=2578111 RepID=UPI0011185419|nr:glycosyltransferase family 4 protein [Variovorax sp. KBS0712]TSD55229.1 glycosyltransferase family 4 protein [Variovorax sp. KBS0712]